MKILHSNNSYFCTTTCSNSLIDADVGRNDRPPIVIQIHKIFGCFIVIGCALRTEGRPPMKILHSNNSYFCITTCSNILIDAHVGGNDRPPIVIQIHKIFGCFIVVGCAPCLQIIRIFALRSHQRPRASTLDPHHGR